MIYIKRILWLIGLLPISCVIAFWFMLELFTTPLKLLIHFLIKGRVKDMELEWFDFVSKPCLYYLGMDLAAEEKDLTPEEEVVISGDYVVRIGGESEIYGTAIRFQSYTKKDDFAFSLFPGINFISYRYDDGYSTNSFLVELNWLCWSIFFIKEY